MLHCQFTASYEAALSHTNGHVVHYMWYAPRAWEGGRDAHRVLLQALCLSPGSMIVHYAFITSCPK